ncbi:hypothetical protein ACP4OV_007699 [Aristida adscensionis]
MLWKKRNGGGGGSPCRGAGMEKEAGKAAAVVPRGHVPMVLAGGGAEEGEEEEGERVVVPVRLLGDPSVAELLEMAAERFGYGQPGVLRVPCDAGHFRRVVEGAMHRCGIS